MSIKVERNKCCISHCTGYLVATSKCMICRIPVLGAAQRVTSEMTLDIAEDLAKETNYADLLCDADGENPVNWGDAAAFFLEGVEYALKKLKSEGAI